MRVRAKICGITRKEDAQAAAALGADALGFVFWAQSPRAIVPERAAGIIATLPPFVTPVGLLVDPSPEAVRSAIAAGCALLQFHGDETPAFCGQFGHPWIKAVRVQAQTDLRAVAQACAAAGARGLLLDAFVPGVPGGTGRRFDWTLIPRDLPLPVVLAGGLDADNVEEAIRIVRPWAVDVSGGVESAKGIKDRARMAAFLAGVKRVNEEN
ncbi:MAG: phosphoribosylanthranilate isomerase [Pseudomonadota bacterium]